MGWQNRRVLVSVGHSLQSGDFVRVVRMPPHLDAADYPHPEVQAAFKAALGKVFRVEGVDWGGWVFLQTKDGGIGVQPDCVELVEEILEPLD